MLSNPVFSCKPNFQSVFEKSPTAIAVSTLPDGIFVEANEAFLCLHGYSREELLGHTSDELGLWNNGAERASAIDQITLHGYAYNFSHEYRCKSGKVGRALASVRIMEFEGRQCLVGFLTEINELNEQHLDLLKREHDYLTIFDNMLNGFAHCRVLFDEENSPYDFVYLKVNKTFETLSGLKNVIGKYVSEILPDFQNSDADLLKTFGRVALGAAPVHTEVYIQSVSSWYSISIYSPAPREFVAIFDVITARKESEAELADYRQNLEQLVEQRTQELALVNRELERRSLELADLYDNAPCGYHSLDSTGHITKVNATELRTLGYTEGEFVGHHIGEFMTTESFQAFTNYFIQFKTTGTVRNLELDFVRKDRSIQSFLINGDAVFSSNGKFLFTRSTLTDNNERKASNLLIRRMQNELLLRAQAAESANIAKSSFLANMSHEIRTPLNIISGLAHLIRREGLSATQEERLNKLESAGEHLLDIINSILDLSKIEAGKFTLDEAPVCVRTLLDDIAAMLAVQAEAKGLSFSVETSPLPDMLSGDPVRLRQALLNYGSNAIKFTVQGNITLRTRVLDEDHRGVLLHFEIEDTGIGIPEATLPKLFSRFEQADSTTTRRYGGTGLGLAINRKFAELMGGAAGVDSTEGIGSRFWFTARLPRGVAPMPIGQETQIKHAESALKATYGGHRILVVDDEFINREIAVALIEGAGQTVNEAEDGLEALMLVRQHTYDLILMDMQMPNMDGLEATRQIRHLPHARHTPILAMTANAFAEDKALCFEAGMDDFIAKPINPDALFNLLLKWIAIEHAGG
jgi:PAS domain S-box-containing protein